MTIKPHQYRGARQEKLSGYMYICIYTFPFRQTCVRTFCTSIGLLKFIFSRKQEQKKNYLFNH